MQSIWWKNLIQRSVVVSLLCMTIGVAGCVPEEPVDDGDWEFEEETKEPENLDRRPDAPDDCTDSSVWPALWVDQKEEMVDLVNATRTAGAVCGDEQMPAVEAVEPNLRLEQAARCHVMDMAENRFLAHEGSDGQDEIERAINAGYGSDYVGENLARGSSDAEKIFASLMESPGHCRNIMHADYEEIGVAYIRLAGRGYWAQSFGTQW